MSYPKFGEFGFPVSFFFFFLDIVATDIIFKSNKRHLDTMPHSINYQNLYKTD